jgi:predicted SAM-dependent methyltransferase
MKLHLGCGQRYFQGYVNIDYPLSEHSVQQTSVADEYQDLLELTYAKNSIDEIRLHHVFEHFSRAQTCALLAAWNSWLINEGRLRIEVPDFEKTARAVLRVFASQKSQFVGLRHIFGSQEAPWAMHFEGYTKRRMKHLLELFGFQVIAVQQKRYLDTYNLEVIALKQRSLSVQESLEIAKRYLSNFLVADVPSERVLLKTWMKDTEGQLAKSFAKNA